MKMVNQNRQPWQMLLASLPLLTVFCVQLVSSLFNSISVNHNHKNSLHLHFFSPIVLCMSSHLWWILS